MAYILRVPDGSGGYVAIPAIRGEKGPPGKPGDGSGDVLWSELDPILDGKAKSSRVTALEGSQPIIVSSLPASPLPGRIYFVTG